MENKDVSDLPIDNGVSPSIAGNAERTDAAGGDVERTVMNSVIQESELNLNLEDGSIQTSIDTASQRRVSARELNNLLSANTPGLVESTNPVLSSRRRPNYQQMKKEFENSLGVDGIRSIR